MNTALQILVVITSVFLVIFLIVAIILIVLVIGVTKKIRAVASSGEAIAHNIECATKGASRAGAPLFFVSLLRGLAAGKSKKGRK